MESGRVVLVEDDRTGMDPVTVRRAVLDHLRFTRARDLRSATLADVAEWARKCCNGTAAKVRVVK